MKRKGCKRCCVALEWIPCQDCVGDGMCSTCKGAGGFWGCPYQAMHQQEDEISDALKELLPEFDIMVEGTDHMWPPDHVYFELYMVWLRRDGVGTGTHIFYSDFRDGGKRWVQDLARSLIEWWGDEKTKRPVFQ